MTILYRILGAMVNMFAMLLLIAIIFNIATAFSSPLTLLSTLSAFCVVLYTWFSGRFRRQVLQQQQAVSVSLRDWIRVNGLVTLVYSVVLLWLMWALMQDPTVFIEQMKNMNVKGMQDGDVLIKSVRIALGLVSLFGIVLIVHVLWTFALIRKNIEYFKL